MQAFSALVNARRRGSRVVPGGFEWAAATRAMGNIHELDVRDGFKQWGDNNVILNHANYVMDTGLTTTGGKNIYVLSCAGVLVQKEALASMSKCHRAHAPGIHCDHRDDTSSKEVRT